MVTTPDGSHGLKYSHASENEVPPFHVATSATEFADTVLKLYNDNDLWRSVRGISATAL